MKVRERRTERERERETDRQTQREIETVLVFVYALCALGRARACAFMDNVPLKDVSIDEYASALYYPRVCVDE